MNVKENCLLYNKKIVQEGLAVDKFGNAGIREGENLFIKPSGVDLQNTKAGDISVVEIRTGKQIGGLKPSSDAPTYVEILNRFPEINAVIHTHSLYATIWAQSKKSIPCLGTTHADYWKHEIPLTRGLSEREITVDYEISCGKVIIEKIEDLNISVSDCPGILLHSHGPFVWGPNIEEAFRNAILLEYIAELAFKTYALGKESSPLPESLHVKHFSRKHGSNAYYGQ